MSRVFRIDGTRCTATLEHLVSTTDEGLAAGIISARTMLHHMLIMAK